MDDLRQRLVTLGRAVAEHRDDGASSAAIERARRKLLAPAAPSGSTRRLAMAMAAALAVIGLVVIGLVVAPSRALSFVVAREGREAKGAIGEWVAAPASAPIALRFSDGTTIAVDAGARARVTRVTARGAEVLIERGGVHADVVHAAEGTLWAIHAGPFEVIVTGTSFHAAWDPSSERFELSMIKGSVRVIGPFVPAGRVVVAGEHLAISVRDGRMELTNVAPVSSSIASAAIDARPPVEAPPTIESAKPAASAPPSPSASAAPASTWRALAAKGRHREAIEAAEQAGFDGEIARASSSDLFLLADAARFAGRIDRAKQALGAARSRAGQRGRSAFLLGKIAADQEHDAASAARWFEACVADEPGGPLEEQALGRLVELRRDKDLAARYLARYPSGAYAPIARAITSP